MLFQDGHVHARPGQQQPQHHARRASTYNSARRPLHALTLRRTHKGRTRN
ncbi:MAG: hypothetical protein NVS2B15_06510 [Pseudarthrobacter sp.]